MISKNFGRRLGGEFLDFAGKQNTINKNNNNK